MFFCACVFLLHGAELSLIAGVASLSPSMRVLESIMTVIFPQDAVLLYFVCSRFPSLPAGCSRWRRLDRLVVIGAVTVLVSRLVLALIRASGEDTALNFFSEHWRIAQAYSPISRGQEGFYLSRWDEWFFFFTLVMAIVTMSVNYWQLKTPDIRRRFRWVQFGLIVGLMPTVVHVAGDMATGGAVSRMRLFAWIAGMFIGQLPIMFCLAIFTRSLPDVEVVLRSGVQHLLAKNVLRVLLFLPVALIVGPIALNPNRTVTQALSAHSVAFYVVIIAALALSLRFRAGLLNWIDKRFFREAYRQEQILLDLSESLKRLASIHDLAVAVKREIDRALHPETVLFYFREEASGDLLSESSPRNAPSLISSTSRLIGLLEDRKVPVDCSALTKLLREQDAELLLAQKIALVVPCVSAEQSLTAVLLLSEKKSQQPYSARDRSLLQLIATQLSISLENAKLREKVRKQERVHLDILSHFDKNNVRLLKQCPDCGACYSGTTSRCDRDGKDLVIDLPIERFINERYRLDSFVGKGGMGAVFRATDLKLNREVAVKVMFSGIFEGPSGLRRFHREARVIAMLRHPNLISIHDFGELTDRSGYFVMEFIHGPTWRAELQRVRTFAPELLAHRIDQVLKGIASAHARGVIHRDLKPENIILNTEAGIETVKIVDFGLAKFHEGEDGDPKSLTTKGVFVGTPGYMAPEQQKGAGNVRSGHLLCRGHHSRVTDCSPSD